MKMDRVVSDEELNPVAEEIYSTSADASPEEMREIVKRIMRKYGMNTGDRILGARLRKRVGEIRKEVA